MLLRNLLETRVIVEIYLFDVVKRQSHTARRDLRKCERDTSEMSVCVFYLSIQHRGHVKNEITAVNAAAQSKNQCC